VKKMVFEEDDGDVDVDENEEGDDWEEEDW
jgi:hypothetical protein